MKKLASTILLSAGLISSAFAGPHGHHGHWHHRGGPSPWIWVAPTIIGGVVGYEIARSQQPVVVQPPVVIQQPPVVIQAQNCGPWTQVQNPDGTITTTRTCTQ